MAITIDTYSTQLTGVVAAEKNFLKQDELGGRIRCAYFQYVASGAQAALQVLGFTVLPKGARYLGGKIYSDGAVATADLDVGLMAADGSGFIDEANSVADDEDLLGDAIDIATAGVYELTDTEPAALGYKLEKECYVVGTLKTAGLADADVLAGVIFYAV